MPGLKNPQHEVFAVQVAKGVNQYKAYVAAGYGQSTSGPYDLMRANPEIETRISEIQGVMAMRSQATADRVIAELARIGFADITEMVSIERGRLKMKDTKDISPDLRAAIQEIQKGKTGIKVKLHDKIAALQHIGKHLGLFKENVDLNVNISLADLVNGSYQLASDGQVVDVTPAAADEPSGDT